LYENEDVVESDGWARKSGTSIVVKTFKGNVNFSKLDKIREDYGIVEDIDMIITTNEVVANDSIIGYQDRQYKVIRSIPFDTHNLLIAQKWSSKSSTSISA